MPRTVYNIKFKRSQRNFVAGPRINRDLDIGCYVKVEADRGEDLGIVVGKMPAEKFNAAAGRASFRPPSNSPTDLSLGPSGVSPSNAADLKRVIRLATHDEVNLLSVKREEEDELLRICRTKVRQRGLPMNVVDAEYQFDRHKLTFFFEAEGRVDFRELVRDLFSIYKTRIWMQQLDKNASSGTQPVSRGHSPIGGRPEYSSSEYSASSGGNPRDTDRSEAYTN
jgi:cell fate regulator YaaT (PSP1 superfamily)